MRIVDLTTHVLHDGYRNLIFVRIVTDEGIVGLGEATLINRTEAGGHAVLFRLVGTTSNKAGIGARATLSAENLIQFNEVRGGASYLSQNDMRLHFGLGPQTIMKTVEISWPSGKKDTYSDLATGLIYTISEGEGILKKVPFNK